MKELSVYKYGVVVPISDQVIADRMDLDAWIRREASVTPEEREARIARRRADMAAVRAAERQRPVTADALLVKLGWGPRYAEHFVQPYCRCEDDRDGWYLCEHASDLGLSTSD